MQTESSFYFPAMGLFLESTLIILKNSFAKEKKTAAKG